MIELPSDKLKSMLVKEGVVKAEDFDKFLAQAKRNQQNVVDLIVSQGLMSLDDFYNLVAKTFKVERVNLGMVRIDEEALHLLPKEIAQARGAIVFGREPDGTYKVALEDPLNLETIDFLQRRLKAKVKVFLAADADLKRGFALYEAQLAEDFRKIIEESIKQSVSSGGKKTLAEAAADLPIVAIVNNLFAYAISRRASDIHFDVLEEDILVRYRIDGVLYEITRIPRIVHPAIVARIKILAGLRIDEHARPQDGRFRHRIGGNEYMDVRVAIMPVLYGEKVEMRLLPSTQKPLSLAELGMLKDFEKIVMENIKKSYGMLLVCGPTGSGKTTTLYSILGLLNKPEVNIVTIEDPIEYNMRYVNQTQINLAAGITFANGLRAILRQDPNIVMVGEIRDGETAEIAVHAALTGHLMLSSLHTNDAPTAIPRLLDMKVPSFLVAAVLNAVLSQRLVRKIHLGCREKYVPDKAVVDSIARQLKEAGLSEDKMPKVFYRGRGCPEDNNTGYLGRMGIFEILNAGAEIRKLIVEPNFSADDVRQAARKEGFITMFEDGLRKVEQGLTTIEEVFRVIRE